MARATLALAAAALLKLAAAQNPGTISPEVHPVLLSEKCTTAGGCVTQNTSVVLDFNYRWIHTADYQSCTTSTGLNTTLCPDEATCAKNCVVEGSDYVSAGIKTDGAYTLKLNQYYNNNGTLNSVSPRVYLLDQSSGNYVDMKLLGQELTFDVDLSTTPCGENGALYLSEMDMSGGRNVYQQGGANYGGGYCDAQCPVQNFFNGTLNTGAKGYCCNEMDILESNSRAAAMTPHPCADDGSNCDRNGCGFNAYNQGYPNYWAPGGTLDTSKPFTVTTQFITDTGLTTGKLVKINRIYQQNGVTLPPAVIGGDSINSTWCSSVDSGADTYGNLERMGEALGRGMVLIFSAWNDNGQFMNWLDSGSNGPCNATEGNPALIAQNDPNTYASFGNIKWGDIGSTIDDSCDAPKPSSSSVTSAKPTSTYSSSAKPTSTSSSSVKPTSTYTSSSSSSSTFTSSIKSTTSTTSTTAKPTTTLAPTTTSAKPTSSAAVVYQTKWGQCGGIGYSGPTVCSAPAACASSNAYYSQCL